MQRISRRRFIERAGVATAGALTGAGTFTTAVRAQSLDKVTIGVVSSSSDAPFFLAEKLGYFRDAGIEATLTPFTAAPQMIAPLGTGQLDVGSGSPSAGFYNGVARGINVRMVANKASSPPDYGFSPLMVRSELVKSGRYKSPKDLKGMKIAEPAPGGETAATLVVLLNSVGLAYTDVSHVYLGFADQIAALTNGSIDASLLNEPSASIAERSGAAIRVLANDKWYPDQDTAEVFYGSSMLTRRDVGMRLLTAWLRAARFYMGGVVDGKLKGKNAARIIDILTDVTPIKDRAIYANMVSQSVQPNGKINVATLSRDLAFYKSAGFLVSDIKVADTIDLDFQLAAVKQLGAYNV